MLRARMPRVQENGQLLAKRFVALGMVTGNDGVFEQKLLDILRQFAPGADHRLTECQSVAIFGVTVSGIRRHGSALRKEGNANRPVGFRAPAGPGGADLLESDR